MLSKEFPDCLNFSTNSPNICLSLQGRFTEEICIGVAGNLLFPPSHYHCWEPPAPHSCDGGSIYTIISQRQHARSCFWLGPPLGNYHKKSHLVSEWHLGHPQAPWVLTKWWSEVLWSLALKSVLCCDTLSKDEAKSRARKANTALYFGEDPKTCPKCPKTRLSCVVKLYEQESTEAQGHEMWILFLSQPHPSTNKSLCVRTKHTFSLCLKPWRPGPLPMGIAQCLSHGWFFFYLWNKFKAFCLLWILCCLIQEPVLCPSLLSLWVSLPHLGVFPKLP